VSLIDSVVAFGKIYFVPGDESVPLLPEMSLLFLEKKEQDSLFPWRAVCIDLMMDACGSTIDGAAKNLKKSLSMYIDMEKKAAGGSIAEAAKIITREAFSKGKHKKEYFDLYRKAKEKYIIQTIEEKISDMAEENEKLRSKKEAIASAFSRRNDVVWQKIIASSLGKRKTLNSAVSKNWILLYTPNNSSRIPAHIWKNNNMEYLRWDQTGVLAKRQVAYSG